MAEAVVTELIMAEAAMSAEEGPAWFMEEAVLTPVPAEAAIHMEVELQAALREAAAPDLPDIVQEE